MLVHKSLAVAILAVVGLVLLQFMGLLTIPRVAASVERLLTPIADAWVDVGYNKDDNHGGDPELWVGQGTLAIDRAYLKFDFSPIPTEATIMEAELILRMSSTDHPTEAKVVGVYYCPNDDWSEMVIDGYSAPDFSEDATDIRTVTDVWTYEWTVTDDVKYAFWKNKVSFVVKWVDESGALGDHTKKFNSKEAATDVPVLSVRYRVDGDTVAAVAGSTPTLDGVITSAEWNDASSFVFAVAPSFEVTTYVKQDGTRLYVAVDIPDEKQWGTDGTILYFDANNDNATPPQPDDRTYMIYRNGVSTRSTGNGTHWVEEPSTDWSVVRTTSSTGWQIEFSFDYSELLITVGEEKTLGFHVWTWNLDEYGSWEGDGKWPYEGGFSGGIYSVPPHWIPEFSAWASMLLMLIMLTGAIATYKRRLPKTTTH